STPGIDGGKKLLRLLQRNGEVKLVDRIILQMQLFLATKWSDLRKGPELSAAIGRLLDSPRLARWGLQLIAAAEAIDMLPRVSALANDPADPAVQGEAVRTLGRLPTPKAIEALQNLFKGGGVIGLGSVEALGQHAAGRGTPETSKAAVMALQDVLRNSTTDSA